ncbi:MAG: hypothetical protein GPOALKHO_000224 [Sodalis sp.]|nr:MAG: hypothetical protein GPOALKHO_000224 [Sodalis sp.]
MVYQANPFRYETMEYHHCGNIGLKLSGGLAGV